MGDNLNWRRAHREHLREYNRAWKSRNQDRVKQARKEYYVANREKELAAANARNRARASLCQAKPLRVPRAPWRERNKQHRANYMAKYRVANRDRILATNKMYKKKNWAKVAELNRVWYSKNYPRLRERKIAQAASWSKSNPAARREISRAGSHRRRSRSLAAPGSFTSRHWLQKVAYYGSRCYYCKSELPIEKLTQDHAIPLVRGGTNFIANILPACQPCNSKKQTKTVFEFLGAIAT